jgi:RHS repeat-associated protein
MEDGAGVTTYSYNPLNALEAATYPGGKTVTYAYDAVGNRGQMANPDGGLTTYSYDAKNQLQWLANPQNERTSFVYDGLGRPITQQNANGAWVSYTYDDADRLTRLANLKSDNTTLSSFAYSLDNIGNRIGVTEANGDVITWSYDNAYQLTREQRSGANTYDITYSYDAVGNRLIKIEGGQTTTYTYDAANQVQTEETPAQITTFAFDANGNTLVENAGGQRTTYTWDLENMCTGIALPNGTLNTFAYDADLVRRQAEDSQGLVKFIHDGENVLLETDSGGTTQAAYTLEPQAYGNLISQRRSGATAWHLFDALGSTERLTNNAETTLVTYLHKAFGITTVLTGSSPNRCTWLGRLGYRWEPDSQQYDVRRRRLNPNRGAWLSVDSQHDGGNFYTYVLNSPLASIDPAGLWKADDHFNETLRIASVVREAVKAELRGFSQEAARIIAGQNSSRDHPQYLGSGWHFESHWCVFPPHEPRSELADKNLKEAINLASAGRRNCVESWKHLGWALHAFQDDSSHHTITPCEHMLKALIKKANVIKRPDSPTPRFVAPEVYSGGWVDNKNAESDWSIMKRVAPKDWRSTLGETTAIDNACGCKRASESHRVFKYKINKHFSKRWNKASATTQSKLREYLRSIPVCSCYIELWIA